MYTEIECPSCKTLVKAEDVIPKERKASCYSCGNIFDVSRDIDIRLRNKYKIYQPKGVKLLKTRELLEMDFPMMTIPSGCAFWPVFGGIVGMMTTILMILVYFRIGIFDVFTTTSGDWFQVLFFFAFILMFSFSIANQIKKFVNLSRIDIIAKPEKLKVLHIEKGKKESLMQIRGV